MTNPLITKLRALRDRLREANTPGRVYEDDETRDKVLRSLRRERRTQKEEQEKIRLRQTIANYNRARVSKELFGIRQPARHNPINRRKQQQTTWTGGGIL